MAASMVFGMVGQAGAEEPVEPPSAEQVAESVAAIEAVTEAVDAETGTEVVAADPGSGDSAAVADTPVGTVEIPASADGDIGIGAGVEAVEIGLPEGIGGLGALDATGETVVYSDVSQPTDLAVQATEGGARALITIKDASASNRYA
ncbi:MAG: hypothetical protein ACLGI3_10935, partial [Actinomycetes bacterium]